LNDDDESLPFEIKPIPNKGLGIVATRTLSPGDLILQETPLLVSSKQLGPTGIISEYFKLSIKDQKLYNSLSIARIYENDKKFPEPLGISLTNAFELAGAGEGGKSGIFIKGARFNHSCLPNVNHFWDEKLNTMWFICTSRVEKGQELCLYYNDLRKPKSERQIFYKKIYDFDCTCRACSSDLTEEEISASDNRRIRIKNLQDSLPKANNSNESIDSPLKTLETIKEILKLLNEEGLVVTRREMAVEAMTLCVLHGDSQNSKLWFEKVLEFERFGEGGIWSSRYKLVENARGRLESSPDWEKNEKLVLVGPDE